MTSMDSCDGTRKDDGTNQSEPGTYDGMSVAIILSPQLWIHHLSVYCGKLVLTRSVGGNRLAENYGQKTDLERSRYLGILGAESAGMISCHLLILLFHHCDASSTNCCSSNCLVQNSAGGHL